MSGMGTKEYGSCCCSRGMKESNRSWCSHWFMSATKKKERHGNPKRKLNTRAKDYGRKTMMGISHLTKLNKKGVCMQQKDVRKQLCGSSIHIAIAEAEISCCIPVCFLSC
ncbi:hypothetical protein Droror1_Dr00022909 [Drosera rotundifolia]